ncbi:MAG TPA: Dyp-type peroxidase [Segetibacter sp.]|nr:Dyp-type peroxidase [Segetibacter sp.]
MSDLDLDEIQGLIKRGYDNMPFSNIVLLRIQDPGKAKQWLGSIHPNISRGSTKNSELEMNVAFTYEGFKILGLQPLLVKPFSREFEEGMTEKSRSRLLGDYNQETRQPTVDNWQWRDGQGDDGLHLILLIYGKEEHLVENYCSELKLCTDQNGLSEIKTLITIKLNDRREHFGFRDGISQPYVKEFASTTNPKLENNEETNTVALGEFVLGYPNEYGKLTESPVVRPAVNGEEFDFGKNGTYLVMRQLEQDVKNFWEFMEENSRNPGGSTDMYQCIALASKMVGRWPSGAPLASSPDHDDPSLEAKNDFLFEFQKEENFGKCPRGAHIARANPRDALDKDRKKALEVANHHRILRRGRSYGRPFITSMEPDKLFSQANKEYEERGLHFICLNTNISRQFEFVQSKWLNNKKFNGLYNDADPISVSGVSDFTIPQRPVTRQIKEIPSFITVKGGGYFFMPSLSAIKFLMEH